MDDLHIKVIRDEAGRLARRVWTSCNVLMRNLSGEEVWTLKTTERDVCRERRQRLTRHLELA
jgi:hypothetical protein